MSLVKTTIPTLALTDLATMFPYSQFFLCTILCHPTTLLWFICRLILYQLKQFSTMRHPAVQYHKIFYISSNLATNQRCLQKKQKLFNIVAISSSNWTYKLDNANKKILRAHVHTEKITISFFVQQCAISNMIVRASAIHIILSPWYLYIVFAWEERYWMELPHSIKNRVFSVRSKWTQW